MLAFFRLIRVTNLLLIALCLYLFYYVIIIPVHSDKLQTTINVFTHTDFALFVLSVVLVAAAGNIINDYFDFELDKNFKPQRPLAAGAFTLDTAVYLHAFFALSGIALGFYVAWQAGNYKIGYIYIVCVLLLYGYSAYLKKVPLLGNVLIAGMSAFVLVILMMFEAQILKFLANTLHYEHVNYVMDILLWQLYFYGALAFLIGLAREIIKDLEDCEGDAAFDINTLPVRFGTLAAKAAAACALLVLLVFVAYFQKLYIDAKALKQFYYLLFAVLLPTLGVLCLLFYASKPKDYHLLSYCLKGIMLLGILSIPAFYLFSH